MEFFLINLLECMASVTLFWDEKFKPKPFLKQKLECMLPIND